MKKFLSFILIFCVSFSYSQTWSSYGIKVAPEHEETVLKIMDDYFTKNKIEGVTVSLYSIMFTAADLNFTHEVIFSGEGEALTKLMSQDFKTLLGSCFHQKLTTLLKMFFQDKVGETLILEKQTLSN